MSIGFGGGAPNIWFGQKPAAGQVAEGQAETFEAKNITASAILKGKAVSAQQTGSELGIILADNSHIDSECDGFATEIIAAGGTGTIQVNGQINALSGAAPADIFYLAKNGNIVAANPNAPFTPEADDKIIQAVGFAASTSVLQIRIREPHQLQLLTTPDEPLPIMPADTATGADIDPTFSWSLSTSWDAFHFQLSEQDNFTSIVEEYEDIKATSIDISSLDYNTTYYWRVRTRLAEEFSVWSTIFSFTTKGA